ncbi:MAG TPA: PQQ-binding-like beta-propeller repeat protein [Terriglobia bacterium]|nr:PQQ-binding-like beta-propeller repeat protein [Terriglobia bacterium]
MTRRSFTLKTFLIVLLLAGVQHAQAPNTAPTATPVPADFALAAKGAARNWPAFRGPNASGVGDGQGAIVEWDTAGGKNVLWKTPVPGLANNSPIVWGNRIYITTAISGAGDTTFQAGISGNIRSHADDSEHTFKLYALDAANGNIVWESEVHKGTPRTKRHPKASHASSTAVTDGQRIVVLFGNAGVLAAYDLNGRQIWKKDLGVIDMGYVLDPTAQWGHSSSPILYQNSTIIQIDQLKGSYIAAFNLADGTELWKTMRDDEISTWGTPAVVSSSAGDELVTNGTKIRGYDAKTGKLRWTLAPNSQVVIPTPIAGPELVYVTGGYMPARPIYAIRPGGSGDISMPAGTLSSERIPWSSDREGVYIPTPILYRDVLYTLNNTGVLTAYNALTGERIYRGRVGTGGAFSASPIAADGRLYFANEDGDVFVVRAGNEYVQIAVNKMGEPVTATPAISNGLLVVRTTKAIYGLGQK